jgi:hypothetical protein
MASTRREGSCILPAVTSTPKKLSMYIGKKLPPMRNIRIRYVIKTDHDEFPREISIKARSRDHARKRLFELVRNEFSNPVEIIIVDIR